MSRVSPAAALCNHANASAGFCLAHWRSPSGSCGDPTSARVIGFANDVGSADDTCAPPGTEVLVLEAGIVAGTVGTGSSNADSRRIGGRMKNRIPISPTLKRQAIKTNAFKLILMGS